MAAMVLSTLGMQAEDKVTAKVSGSNVNVGLENETSFCAFQMDIKLPAGVNVTEVVANTDRLKKGSDVTIDSKPVSTPFEIAYNVLEGNVLRVIAYNLGNNMIQNIPGDILSIKLDNAPASADAVTVSNILFVNASDLAELSLENVVGVDGYKVGDVNMSGGEPDMLDLARLIKILLNQEPETPTANVNGVGGVDMLDLAALIKLLL